jgi:uncharacterized protein YgbK (DUF1537 family)
VPANNLAIAQAKSAVAVLHRRAVAATPEQISEAKAKLEAAKLEAAVERALANAPAMTDAQRQRIAGLLLAGGDVA